MLSDTPVSVELSQVFKYAMQLAFSMLSFVLRNPTRKTIEYVSTQWLGNQLSLPIEYVSTVGMLVLQ